MAWTGSSQFHYRSREVFNLTVFRMVEADGRGCDRRPNMVMSSVEYNTTELGGCGKVTTHMMVAIDEMRSNYH